MPKRIEIEVYDESEMDFKPASKFKVYGFHDIYTANTVEEVLAIVQADLSEKTSNKTCLKLAMDYDYDNHAGSVVEVLKIEHDTRFGGNIAVLTKLVRKNDPVWLSIEWFTKL